jgi:hypothetical protein
MTVLVHRGRLQVWHMFVNGGLYVTYVTLVISL